MPLPVVALIAGSPAPLSGLSPLRLLRSRRAPAPFRALPSLRSGGSSASRPRPSQRSGRGFVPRCRGSPALIAPCGAVALMVDDCGNPPPPAIVIALHTPLRGVHCHPPRPLLVFFMVLFCAFHAQFLPLSRATPVKDA